MNRRLSASLLAALTCVSLTGCFSSSNQADDFSAMSAVRALTYGTLERGELISLNRPTAPLAIFAALYLSGGGFWQSVSAIEGVIVQVKLHAKPSQEEINSLYDLLQEFGLVLQVDITDLLNRSDNRSETLNEYTTGLDNITERSRRRSITIQAQIEELRTEQKTRRATVSQTDKSLREALKNKEYGTAGSLQSDLAKAQAELTDTESQLSQQQTLLDTFKQLLAVAIERQEAISRNREILVAGLKAVDIPGAESLGILERVQKRRTPTNVFGL